DERVAARAAEVDQESLVRLLLLVAVYDDRDGLGGLPRCERQRPALRLVVVVGVGRRAIGGGEVHRHGLVVGGREAHREDEQRLAVVAFQLRDVADRDRRRVQRG